MRPLSLPAWCRGTTLAVLPVLAMACSPDRGDRPATGAPVTLQVVDTVRLQDAPGDTIAQIGHVHVLPDGKLLVADALVPRVRLYEVDGTFRAGQGRSGDGRFEYQRISSVGTDAGGRVLVTSFQPPRTTVLTPELEPDTMYLPPEGMMWMSLAQPFAGGAAQLGFLPDSARLLLRTRDGGVAWSVPAGPRDVFEKPYWGASFHMAVVGDRLFLANSLLYPIDIHGPDGSRISGIGTPPPSFRPVPDVEAGTFAFTDIADAPAVMSRMAEWYGTFDVVTGIHAVADRWLVVVHGRYRTDPPRPPFQTEDTVFDVYDLETDTKVLEDVPLDPGARVVSGGAHLHVLVSEPPEPWAIIRYRIGEG